MHRLHRRHSHPVQESREGHQAHSDGPGSFSQARVPDPSKEDPGHSESVDRVPRSSGQLCQDAALSFPGEDPQSSQADLRHHQSVSQRQLGSQEVCISLGQVQCGQRRSRLGSSPHLAAHSPAAFGSPETVRLGDQDDTLSPGSRRALVVGSRSPAVEW